MVQNSSGTYQQFVITSNRYNVVSIGFALPLNL